MEIISNNVKETISFAENFAESLKRNDIIALNGEMGAGKTHFVMGLCEGLGLPDIVSSPTYSLVNDYRPTEEFSEKIPLYHFDMYRVLGDPSSTGIDYYQRFDGIIVIEWFENIEGFITPNINIKIEILSNYKRKIIVNDFRN